MFLLFYVLMVFSTGVARAESPEQWFEDGQKAVEAAKRLKPVNRRARNVILFIGDGMGVSTVTAARILEGQLRGKTGEENLLSFERLPYVALSKTYNTNQQVPDSAGAMTAMVTGVKTKAGLISVNQNVIRGDYTTVSGNELTTILEIAEKAGMSTGVVTTTRITHATPAATYAHSPERNWEDDHDLPADAKAADFPDIARQLIEFPYGDGLEVALGGGRRSFLPRSMSDPEYPDKTGERDDSRNLTKEWLEKYPFSDYVWNKARFDAIDPDSTEHLLGLFEPSHMKYEYDRAGDAAGEPSLSEMTSKAIDILAKNKKGFFLMVEGGRIDHAHHAGNAFRALRETIEFSNAIRTAMGKIDPENTLVIVTADHSHVFTMAGYPTRGNDILGKVIGNDGRGEPLTDYATDSNGLPYTTLGYANGPGYIPGDRPDLTGVNTAAPDYRQEATIPKHSETHAGEDVAIYAGGPGASLLHGVQEQNVIYHVIAEALKKTGHAGHSGEHGKGRR
ncbi:MAG TPA: alkaline phosphatase [Nitrospirae bacterium]|nr:alkaline phosphatase [Nitrospirota bacterium]